MSSSSSYETPVREMLILKWVLLGVAVHDFAGSSTSLQKDNLHKGEKEPGSSVFASKDVITFGYAFCPNHFAIFSGYK